MTDQQQQILFGRYYAGFDKPLLGLPKRRQIESPAAFMVRRRIIAEIALLDSIFGPVRPVSNAD